MSKIAEMSGTKIPAFLFSILKATVRLLLRAKIKCFLSYNAQSSYYQMKKTNYLQEHTYTLADYQCIPLTFVALAGF